MSSSVPARSEADLSAGEHQALEDAHRELRATVAAYEGFLGKERQPGTPVTVVSAEGIQEAQERVENAERRLWDLRERLLGWARPPWAPPATLV
ncbi:MAG: hypothetical protein ACRDYY_15555, partial [Acidimicrobiales bacterium]